MTDATSNLIFFEGPEVEYASNRFKDVPVILQYGDTPLIEVVQLEGAGFTTKFSIYNRDSIYLAKVRGARLFLTDEGEKANLALRHPDLRTICELDGKTIFELSRKPQR